MTGKNRSGSRSIFGSAQPLVLAGLVLLVISAIAINTGLASRIPTGVEKPRDLRSRSLSPTPTTAASQTDPTVEWRVYSFSDAVFKHPATWEILNEVPGEYQAKTFGENGWEKSKMFIEECSGPILQSTKVKSTIIAIEVVKPETTDGDFCWSNGDFRDNYTRTITALDPPQRIKVARWRLSPGASWQGDLFQSHSFNRLHLEQPDKHWYLFALVYRSGQDDTAESTLDQILSTFQFID